MTNTASPSYPAPTYVARDMHFLYLAAGTPLSPVCACCGDPGPHRPVPMSVSFGNTGMVVASSFASFIGYGVESLLVLAAPFVTLVCWYTTRKTRSLSMPLCARCASRERRRRYAVPVSTAIAIVALGLMFVVPTIVGELPAEWMPLAGALSHVFAMASLVIPLLGVLTANGGPRLAEIPRAYTLAYGQPPTEIFKLAGIHPIAMTAACTPAYVPQSSWRNDSMSGRRGTLRLQA
jgi:hypothetical protein